MTEKQVGEGSIYAAYIFIPQLIIKGSQTGAQVGQKSGSKKELMQSQ